MTLQQKYRLWIGDEAIGYSRVIKIAIGKPAARAAHRICGFQYHCRRTRIGSGLNRQTLHARANLRRVVVDDEPVVALFHEDKSGLPVGGGWLPLN